MRSLNLVMCLSLVALLFATRLGLAADATGTLLLTSNQACELRVNGGDAVVLNAGSARREVVLAGEALASCTYNKRTDERIVAIETGRQSIVQFVWAVGPNADVPAKPAEIGKVSDAPAQRASARGAVEPQMVVIAAGTMKMGSPGDEAGRESNEGPTRMVRVRSFKLAKYEVTVGEFRRFVDATGYRTDAEQNTPVPGQDGAVGCFAYKGATDLGWKAGTSWKDAGFPQSDDHPAVCVSWRDAQAFIEWLNRQTGKRYRLPSEAEQEYANRAGSLGTYAWGTDANQACAYANVSDSSAKSRMSGWTAVSCDDGALFTTAVGRYKANAFGLHDTIGNASEWGADCYGTYKGGARNSRAVDATNCNYRVLRGAGWDGLPATLRVADRSGFAPMDRYYAMGFRLAEDL